MVIRKLKNKTYVCMHVCIYIYIYWYVCLHSCQLSRATWCFHLQGSRGREQFSRLPWNTLNVGTANSCETLVPPYQCPWGYISADWNFHCSAVRTSCSCRTLTRMRQQTSTEYSRTPLIGMLVIRIANHPDLLGPWGNFMLFVFLCVFFFCNVLCYKNYATWTNELRTFQINTWGEFVENSTKLTCLEITGYAIKYSTALWLPELQIRRGRKV